MDNEALSELIGGIYDCALDRSRWVPMLKQLAGAFDACNGTVLSHGLQSAAFEYHWGTPPEWIRAYRETYAMLNPLLTIGWHAEVDEPITALRFISAEELRKTQFYREFLAPLHWFDFIGVILEKSATRFSMISFARRIDQIPPGERELKLIHLLAPHIRRAAILHGIIEGETSQTRVLAAVLDLVMTPVLLFDAAGNCVEMNNAAERFLRETDVLRWDARSLRTRDPGIDAAIGSGQPLSLGLSDTDGRKFVLHSLPLSGGLRERTGGRQRAVSVMFVQTVGALRPLPGEVLAKLYRLTFAETRLVGLLTAKHSVDTAAAVLGIARSTARTHLRQIFAKTGTSRQSQLMRLVLSVAPATAGDGRSG